MSRTIQDAVAEIKAAFPECATGYTIDGLTSEDPVRRYTEDANGLWVAFILCTAGPTIRMNITRDLAEDAAFDVVEHVRDSLERFQWIRRPLDGMRMKGSG